MHIILAYCYTCSMVCLLVFSVSPAKTAEPTEMQFVEWTHEGPRNHVLDGTQSINQLWLFRVVHIPNLSQDNLGTTAPKK